MQIMQTNENLNPTDTKTSKAVVRPVVSKGSSYELTSDSKTIQLDDGNTIKECSSVTNCRFFPNCNFSCELLR